MARFSQWSGRSFENSKTELRREWSLNLKKLDYSTQASHSIKRPWRFLTRSRFTRIAKFSLADRPLPAPQDCPRQHYNWNTTWPGSVEARFDGWLRLEDDVPPYSGVTASHSKRWVQSKRLGCSRHWRWPPLYVHRKPRHFRNAAVLDRKETKHR